MIAIEELDAAGAERELPALSAILAACVAGGASVGFVLPFTEADAAAWWRARVLPALAPEGRRLLVARLGGRVAGTAQLDLATMPNQRHRADVAKVLVHPDARRQGVARALMGRVEALARDAGRSLLVLDTVEDSAARRLYESLGYALCGVIPRFALSPDGTALEGTAVMFRDLLPPA